MGDTCIGVCCYCGDVNICNDLVCEWCGEDLVTFDASPVGLAAIDRWWVEGLIDDYTYERIQTWAAVREGVDEEQASRPYVGLKLRPVSFKEACAFVVDHHRHHRAPRGWKFGIGVEDEHGELRGVVIVGRPVAMMIATRQPGTFEVTRLCTDGTRNAGSMLLGAARRAVKALARRLKLPRPKLISYLLESESGGCYVAAGWQRVARSRGGSWHRRGRPRVDKAPTCPKWRWEIAA
jgi:hypothetical protein